ncbi:hypothetical protein SARC_09297 [Sphaeroforma arctica JP610]|uniref:DASH complex subunit DAD4 n=1 Tax=Sphaeroforma arctica JP610 TaxID=667725 RepID=A0A0L0FNH2_9EUKA|nr:hypothetical protein SARC_09297 [Sphaeroforma arctica JP610]KNC78269.1 hypothetical protein SARC_09297 [Sphaeroforma arctica JP610]|eukprot:XP_014152171.1 hypothetical protein SARC_09297 [Sphaeroforma arctica JP610]
MMDNPHSEQQHLLVDRIANNVEKLNDTVTSINTVMSDLRIYEKRIEKTAVVWSNYCRNMNLKAGSLRT